MSVLIHGLALGLIGLVAPKMQPREAPQVHSTEVWLMPRLILDRDHAPAMHQAAASAPALSSPRKADKARQTSSPIPAAPTPQAVQRTPAPPAAAPAAPHSPSAPSLPAGEPGGDVQEALRTSVGCDFDKTVHLTPAERERCNQHYGEAARGAPSFSGMDAGKRSRFDAQAEADERRRAGRTGPVQQPIVSCSGPDAVETEGGGLAGGCLPKSSLLHVPF